ncbi:peptidyl-tRNA hydrolase ICT1, mitochondrial-like isoform X2 [Haliotis rufescens]|uniref:peptidyl-tRNA hydrolase ICT1, mitochondrial-like isoform X2 n=1 Tax=Haliotis rufescens TaxID=6454 RepID=UPI00201F88DF|nr:peptidyl-tRNA hydrolase ICT1, mitochondrial-like isoform X2 [Haliotis rufescens]
MLRRSLTCVCRCSGRLMSPSTSHMTRILAAGYRSQYSIDKIYPNSEQDYLGSTAFTHSSSVTPDGKELFSGYIPINKLDIKYSRGSGPGGQNVNKVNTKVEVRFHVESADWIPQWIRERLLEKEAGRITKGGYLVVTSDTTRKQMLNQADCMEKIRSVIFGAGVLPRELTEEEKTVRDKRMAKAKQAVLREKKQHSLKKQHRQTPSVGSS